MINLLIDKLIGSSSDQIAIVSPLAKSLCACLIIIIIIPILQQCTLWSLFEMRYSLCFAENFVARRFRNLRHFERNFFNLGGGAIPKNSLHREFVSESICNIASFNFLGLNVLVVLNKISNTDVSTAYFNFCFTILTKLHAYFLRTILVDSLTFSHEKNFELL